MTDPRADATGFDPAAFVREYQDEGVGVVDCDCGGEIEWDRIGDHVPRGKWYCTLCRKHFDLHPAAVRLVNAVLARLRPHLRATADDGVARCKSLTSVLTCCLHYVAADANRYGTHSTAGPLLGAILEVLGRPETADQYVTAIRRRPT